ncbi:MAG: hypothetical protein IIY75_09480, partial [Erysipelotrichales bacterium]|nr:hypothetical protein [Erysipelotrichales bacterium]
WTWDGYEDAKAKFVCERDDRHELELNGSITSETVKPACETDGETVYTAAVTLEGKEYTDTKTEVLPKTGHSYKLDSWIWNGYESATATFTCKNDPSHTETVNAAITSQRTEPTCAAEGKIVYTATVTFEGKEYTDTKTETLPALGHDYELTGWTWSGYESAKATFTCRNDETHTKTADAIITVTTNEDYTKLYTATVEFEGKTYTDTKTGPGITLEAPKITSLTNKKEGVLVKWSAVENAQKYQVYRRADGTSGYTRIATVTDTEYVDATAENGVTYYYKVRAMYKEEGLPNLYSAYSALKSYHRVEAVSGQKSYNVKTGVYVGWSEVAGADGYYVFRKTAEETKYTKVADVKEASYTDAKAKPEGVYTYRVKAYWVKADGTKIYGAYCDSTTYMRLEAPVLTKLSNETDGIKLTWEAAAGATGYEIYRKAPGETAYTKYDTVKTASLTYTDKNAESGKTYRYQIKAMHVKSNGTTYRSTMSNSLGLKRAVKSANGTNGQSEK